MIFDYLNTVIALPFKKKIFPCQKCDYEINSSAPSVRFKIKLIKGITISNLFKIILIGTGSLYHTQSRAESVSFSLPLNYASQSIFIKNPANVYNYLAYLEPLTYWSWISILILLFAFSFILFTITKLVKEPVKTSIFESFETVYLAIFLLSSPFKPSYLTTRIVLFM